MECFNMVFNSDVFSLFVQETKRDAPQIYKNKRELDLSHTKMDRNRN